MSFFSKISISRKIGIISFCAIATTIIIVAVSLNFFGQITNISGLNGAGAQYRIAVYKASVSYERYLRTQDPADLQVYRENADAVYELDVAPVEIYKLMQSHGSVDDLLTAYKAKHGRLHLTTKEVTELFFALKGNPILKELVSQVEIAHKTANEKRQLAESYLKAEESDQRNILEKIYFANQKHHKAIDDYLEILGDLAMHLKSLIIRIFFAIAIVLILILIAISFFVARSITRPLKETVFFAKELSQGDLTHKVTITNRDELGAMGSSLNQMSQDLSEMLKEIQHSVETLSDSSQDLTSISHQMISDTEDSANRSQDVAAAADKMNGNMRSVASAMDQASENANLVAAAAEEMMATINEIARNAEHARTISTEANGKTKEATVMMNELGEAANGIGKVIVTITEISEQVNLLALNATIEAARAGEAGKGFAVVANEIKDLARQTADATQDIKQKIGTIQETTNSTISQTQGIGEVISNVNEVINGIATAVEEQSAATSEIVNNIMQTSTSIQEVSQHVTTAAEEATSINEAIAEVSRSTEQITSSSNNVKDSSDNLSQLAKTLRDMVSRFKL